MILQKILKNSKKLFDQKNLKKIVSPKKYLKIEKNDLAKNSLKILKKLFCQKNIEKFKKMILQNFSEILKK